MFSCSSSFFISSSYCFFSAFLWRSKSRLWSNFLFCSSSYSCLNRSIKSSSAPYSLRASIRAEWERFESTWESTFMKFCCAESCYCCKDDEGGLLPPAFRFALDPWLSIMLWCCIMAICFFFSSSSSTNGSLLFKSSSNLSFSLFKSSLSLLLRCSSLSLSFASSISF